jgi:hypothetical protein
VDRSENDLATRDVSVLRVAVRSIAWLGVVRSISNALTKLGHAERRRTLMKHSMTVRANGHKVSGRIDGVTARDLR